MKALIVSLLFFFKHQANVALKPQANSFSYKEYFYRVAGFFIVENYIMQTTSDFVQSTAVNQFLIINFTFLFLKI